MKTSACRQPAKNESSAEKPPRTRPARSAPAPRYPRITTGSLRVGLGREARRTLGEQRLRVEDAVLSEPALRDHRDARLEDVRERAGVLDRERVRSVLLRERHVQSALALLHVVGDDP